MGWVGGVVVEDMEISRAVGNGGWMSKRFGERQVRKICLLKKKTTKTRKNRL